MTAPVKIETSARLVRQGNSTGLTLPREVLDTAGLDRGDAVTLTADRETGTITVRRTDDAYARTLAAGRECAVRYRRTLAALAR